MTLDKKPSRVTDAYWLYAKRLTGKYPTANKNSGKWLIFVSLKDLDEAWEKIKVATESGHLGGSSKTATARSSPLAQDNNIKVICIYSYDYTDKKDVMRIREELRKIGIENKISYKTNDATKLGKYRVNGNEKIATYVA